MDPNSLQYLPGMAYVQQLQSKQSDSEFFDPTGDDEPEWIVRQAGRLLSTVGKGLASLSEHIQHEQETLRENPAGGYQESGVHI